LGSNFGEQLWGATITLKNNNFGEQFLGATLGQWVWTTTLGSRFKEQLWETI
jgi:hypothetical protein